MYLVMKMKQNALSIHVSKQGFAKDFDLLLLLSSKNFHYVLVKGFNRFVTNKTKTS